VCLSRRLWRCCGFDIERNDRQSDHPPEPATWSGFPAASFRIGLNDHYPENDLFASARPRPQCRGPLVIFAPIPSNSTCRRAPSELCGQQTLDRPAGRRASSNNVWRQSQDFLSASLPDVLSTDGQARDGVAAKVHGWQIGKEAWPLFHLRPIFSLKRKSKFWTDVDSLTVAPGDFPAHPRIIGARYSTGRGPGDRQGRLRLSYAMMESYQTWRAQTVDKDLE